jgi:hypothetical protein
MTSLSCLLKLVVLVAVAGIACAGDHTPPTIVPLHPKPGDTVYTGSAVEFCAVVFDPSGVRDVFFSAPPALYNRRASCCEPDTYWVVWNTTSLPANQWYQLEVRAEDSAVEPNTGDTVFSYYLAP